MNPRCNRAAGNTGTNKAGTGCAASDICSSGWHICTDYNDVNINTNNKGCTDCGNSVSGDYLFLSRQSSNGCGHCAEGTSVDSAKCNSIACLDGCLQSEAISNDVFGCGNYGSPTGTSCPPFNYFGNNFCGAISSRGWACTSPQDTVGICETYTVTHSNPTNGGVLCCKDATCPDTDKDGVSDCFDNCVGVANPDQKDCDKDGTGNLCDPCPNDPTIDNSNYKGSCPKSFLAKKHHRHQAQAQALQH